MYKFLEENLHLSDSSPAPVLHVRRSRDGNGWSVWKAKQISGMVPAPRVSRWGLGRQPRPLCPLPPASLPAGPHLEPPQELWCLQLQGGRRPGGQEEEPEGDQCLLNSSHLGRCRPGDSKRDAGSRSLGAPRSLPHHRVVSRPGNVSVPMVLASCCILPRVTLCQRLLPLSTAGSVVHCAPGKDRLGQKPVSITGGKLVSISGPQCLHPLNGEVKDSTQED